MQDNSANEVKLQTDEVEESNKNESVNIPASEVYSSQLLQKTSQQQVGMAIEAESLLNNNQAMNNHAEGFDGEDDESRGSSSSEENSSDEDF